MTWSKDWLKRLRSRLNCADKHVLRRPNVIDPQRLAVIIERHEELEAQMASGDMPADALTKASREYARLDPVVGSIKDYLSIQKEVEELTSMLEDEDPDLRAMAREDLRLSQQRLEQMVDVVRDALVPRDEADDRNAIVEIRAGTGGEEAALFAGNLMRMYLRYADVKGWQAEVLAVSATDLGGVKEASLQLSGGEAFRYLKFESGVHRVQRVPETESGGRIHTSAATVAVLPEAEEVDIDLPMHELRIDVFRAQGAGGQHVNTTDSAVRITHIPSGIAVVQQDEKSQHRNKDKALKILRARLYDITRQKIDAERAATRKGQVGSGDRSERIRTYNFPQGRVTDHRINLTLYKLDRVIAGDELDDVVRPLLAADDAARLAADEKM
ncbi:MAG: peptide chain release factor 1 [Alphaproteobacteria bacterium]|nr:peptide chain release factor 1 [Alphaproteobacteria bacterium]